MRRAWPQRQQKGQEIQRRKRRRRGRQEAGQRADVLQLPWQRPIRPRLHRKAVQEVSWKGHQEDKCPSPADMKAHVTIELPNFDAGSSTSSEAAAGFMAREVDTAGCGRLPDAHVVPGKCGGGGSIGGVGGLALRAWAWEDLQSY